MTGALADGHKGLPILRSGEDTDRWWLLLEVFRRIEDVTGSVPYAVGGGGGGVVCEQ